MRLKRLLLFTDALHCCQVTIGMLTVAQAACKLNWNVENKVNCIDVRLNGMLTANAIALMQGLD